jgi:uncharacterized Fe-S cluster-containing MiaB family protein
VVEALFERQHVRPPAVLEIVCEHQSPVGGPQNVELDHVYAGRKRGVEACDRVAGRDVVGALVADAAVCQL